MSKRLITLISTVALLAGCASAPLPKATFPDSPTLKHESVLLYWDQGTVKSAIYDANAEGFQGGILKSIIASQNKNDYRLQYGPETQVPFMTMLRDQLIQHGVFKNVTLLTEPPKALRPDEVMMVVYFKDTAVTIAGYYSAVTLTVNTELFLKDCHGPLFKKSITLTQKPPVFHDVPSKAYQTESDALSNDLLIATLSAITEWQKNEYSGNIPATAPK